VWRRSGDVAFALLFGVAVALEAIPLGLLTWRLLGRIGEDGEGGPVQGLLVGAIASTVVGLVLVMTYIVLYQYLGARRDAALAERRKTWVARWLQILDGAEPAPEGPLPGEAVHALLGLREILRGAHSEQVAALLVRYGAAQRLEHATLRGRMPARLEAIEALASARVPTSLATLARAIEDHQPTVRVAAARAAARTLAAAIDPEVRVEGAVALAHALERGDLPAGIVEEVLVLAEEGAPALVSELLLRDGAPVAALRAALDGVGRLRLLTFAEEVARFLTHADTEVRAAALRATGRLGFLPESAHPAVVGALRDPTEFVRIHATSAARLLPRKQALSVLADGLGDPSWWVRRAAADALALLGAPGLAELGKAARSHPDRFARDMAEQALRERVPALVQAVAG
jgi:HEAT repeat protein